MEAPQKQVFFLTDMQASDWDKQPAWLGAAFESLSESASTFIIPVLGGSDNLAIVGLELVSGVLREGTVARASCNCTKLWSKPCSKCNAGLVDESSS